LIHLYTSKVEEQYTFIQAAKDKGYDVLLMDSVLTAPLINKFEQETPNNRFSRVDADVVDRLILKDNADKITLSDDEREELEPVFNAVTPKGEAGYYVTFEDLGENAMPMVITQNEFMRRMKDMSAIQPGGMYGNLPDSYTLVVNVAHPLVKQVIDEKNTNLGEQLNSLNQLLKQKEDEKATLEKLKEGKKDEEIDSVEKEKLNEVSGELTKLEGEKREKLKAFGTENLLAKQLVDLALLSNNMLKGEALDRFVKRSVELIHK
jgi:molecular chaperone HtpG